MGETERGCADRMPQDDCTEDYWAGLCVKNSGGAAKGSGALTRHDGSDREWERILLRKQHRWKRGGACRARVGSGGKVQSLVKAMEAHLLVSAGPGRDQRCKATVGR